MPGARQIVVQLLDARFVRHRRVWVGLVAGWLGRVAAALTVHVVQPLRFGVIGRQIPVRQGPGRRDAVGMPRFAKIPLTQPQQHRAVHLRVAADPVMDAGVERLAVLVVPGLSCLVSVLGKDCFGVPIFPFTRQVATAFQDQDALPRRGEAMRECAAAGAASDDDDVVMFSGHGAPPERDNEGNRNGRCSDG